MRPDTPTGRLLGVSGQATFTEIPSLARPVLPEYYFRTTVLALVQSTAVVLPNYVLVQRRVVEPTLPRREHARIRGEVRWATLQTCPLARFEPRENA